MRHVPPAVMTVEVGPDLRSHAQHPRSGRRAGATTHAARTFYIYDAAGRRVRKVTETWDGSLGGFVRAADTVYLGGFDLVRKWTGTAGDELDDEIETVHVMDGASRLAIIHKQPVEEGDVPTTLTPKWRYQLDDLIGSACVEVGRDGQVVSYEEYHAYGTTALLIDTGGEGFGKRYRWSGKERDAESGQVHFGARYFAPWLGWWASADPAGAVDGNPYRVVRGNPVGLSEVDGRQGASQYDIADYPDANSSTTPDEAAALRFQVQAPSDLAIPNHEGAHTAPPLIIVFRGGFGGMAKSTRLRPSRRRISAHRDRLVSRSSSALAGLSC
ncbi:MAG: RHS repeat-associated core domain-containing protein [Myxococcales bacterium]|nr:RHS repeat-associated core domain-containing protein [Myxococcales bacterium]MCB9519777.1 RHS repeat-associated core domain-containing protein [Myxococcales bacterium]MCB9530468.1 RHS repeat-associated core domain-containing protein [Myxococcales bacterium]